MERKGTETWTWASTNETQIRLLDAGAKVFGEHGYRNASVAQIVAEAGSSTGSLYHHFGGKAELYMALWREHSLSRIEHVRRAVRLARANGEVDVLELFCVGARSYLARAWERREVGRIFLAFDGPPGFEQQRSESTNGWISRNAGMIEGRSKIEHRVTAGALTHIMSQAAREIAACNSKRQAMAIVEITEQMIRRVWLQRTEDHQL